jgi:hypothetical protein
VRDGDYLFGGEDGGARKKKCFPSKVKYNSKPLQKYQSVTLPPPVAAASLSQQSKMAGFQFGGLARQKIKIIKRLR